MFNYVLFLHTLGEHEYQEIEKVDGPKVNGSGDVIGLLFVIDQFEDHPHGIDQFISEAVHFEPYFFKKLT